MKQSLIYQFEKDDLLFEVHELKNPKQLIIRLKVFRASTFQVLTVSEINEEELKEQLQTDKKTSLIKPQEREELAKYIINNSYYDDHKRSIQFMVSNLVEDI